MGAFKKVIEENQKIQRAIKRFGMQWPMANPATTYVASGPPPSFLSAAEQVAAGALEADVVADVAETLPAKVFDSAVVTGCTLDGTIMDKRVLECRCARPAFQLRFRAPGFGVPYSIGILRGGAWGTCEHYLGDSGR